MRRFAALAALSLVLLGACGSDDDKVAAGDQDTTTTTTTSPATDGGTDTTGSGTTSTTKPGSTTTRPGGSTTSTTTTAPVTQAPAGLAVQIRTGGGFVPVEYNFTNMPEFSLYGDGRVIVTGPTTMEYPGKALPNLLEGRVTTQAVANALKSARAAGIFDKPDLGNPPVADAPSTTFTVVDGDQKVTYGAYALGFDAAGLSPAQAEARRKLSAFKDEMTTLGNAARDAYKATVVSVLVLPYQAQGDQNPAPGSADWPLGNLATGGIDQFGGRCLGFTGADADRVLSAGGQARSNTRWQSGGKQWALSFRPELPGVQPCAPAS